MNHQKPRAPQVWTYTLVRFIRNEAFGGILMLAFATAAMIWANSAWADGYESFWHREMLVGTPGFHLEMSLQHWVNDALMVIFFLVVGLEIKRELLVGELASLSRAALPAVAATGGAIVPAIIFAALNWGGEGIDGWGVPMATDIAFAVGVIALVGSRVPLGLKVFLTALAIVDDLLAVLVIAIFYTSDLDLVALGGAGASLALLAVANRFGIRRLLVYVVLGALLWLFVLQSGIHATVAGVLLAITIPASARIDPASFVNRVEHLLGRIERDHLAERNALTDGEVQEAVQELEDAVNDVEAPLQNLEHTLQPWSAFVIIPLFALANAGVRLDVSVGDAISSPITLGVFFGLLLGKQIGITGAAWLATRLGWATLPAGVTWRQIYGVSWIGGIGFTMSLFVAALAYDDADLLTMSKIGVFSASLVAGIAGWLVLRMWALREPRPVSEPGGATTVPDLPNRT